jgi:serine protease Do
MKVERGPARSHQGREMRLLLLTVAVAVAMLLLLARFRFPDETRPEAPAAPLQRLAARATYDELATIIAQLEGRIAPLLVVLQVDARTPPARAPVLVPSRWPSEPALPTFVPAIRVRPDAVLALVGGGRVRRIVAQPEAAPEVIAADPVRGLELIRVPPVADASWRWERADTLRTPTYVALVEGTRGGPTMRPVFLGRTDPMTDPRWDRSLLVLGGSLMAQPGSLVFSLDGRFVGLTVFEEGLLAVAPAEMLLETAEQLTRGEVAPPGHLGVQLQPLSPALVEATGAERGALVSYVEDTGPAAGWLRLGDVIEAIDGQPIFSPDDLLVRIARTPPGSGLRLEVRRGGEVRTIALQIGTAAQPDPGRRSPELGLALRAAADLGAEVLRVNSGSAAALAGLLPGDVITQIDQIEIPTPADVRQAFAAAPPGASVLLGVDREGRRLVLVLQKP